MAEVRIVVQYQKTESQMLEEFYVFDQSMPLSTIIAELFGIFKLERSRRTENYALKFADREVYVTQRNRSEVKNGIYLTLTFSILKEVKDISNCLETGTLIIKTNTLNRLSHLSNDDEFMYEFIRYKKGLVSLIRIISDERYVGELLKNALSSFMKITHQYDCSSLEINFISRLIRLVRSRSIDPDILHHSLRILRGIVRSDNKNFETIQKEIPFHVLFGFLRESSTWGVQEVSLGIINSMFIKANNKEKLLLSKNFKTAQFQEKFRHLIKNFNELSSEMQNQISIYQRNVFYYLEDRRNSILSFNISDNDICRELCLQIFENDDPESRAKLMFENVDDPIADFQNPPGMLAIDCIRFLMNNPTYKVLIKRIMMENLNVNENNQFPFGKASLKLVDVLYELFHVELIDDTAKSFQPMFFSRDNVFEELFCCCMPVFYKIWKDMKATNNDLSRVAGAVRNLIMTCLRTPKMEIADFNHELNRLDCNALAKNRQSMMELNSRTISDLKQKYIIPEVEELIREKRIRFLIEGSFFPEYKKGAQVKDGKYFVQLTRDRKFIKYKYYPGGFDLLNGTDEDLKIEVDKIKQLLTGNNCPHYKEIKTKSGVEVFTIGYESGNEQKALNFVLDNETQYDFWTDGINALLGLRMNSREYEKDSRMLVLLAKDIQLLDLEGLGIDLQRIPPEIPDDPENYIFGEN